MSRSLPAGITSREHLVSGKLKKQYRACVSDKSQKMPNGKSRQIQSKWFNTLTEAKEWREDRLLELREKGSLFKNKKITVSEACEEWIKIAKKAGIDGRKPIEYATSERYKSTLVNIISPTIGSIKISDLNSHMILKWRDNVIMSNGRDASKRALNLLKSVLSYNVSIGNIVINPAASVKAARTGVYGLDDSLEVKEFMQPSDASHILSVVQDYKGKDRWICMFVYFLMLSGCRMGEACVIKWSDVDFEKGTVNITKAIKRGGKIGLPKNDTSKRKIKMGSIFMEMLKKYRNGLHNSIDNHYVFSKNKVSPVVDANFRARHWKKLMQECDMLDSKGNPKWKPHDLRHYHASVLILSGKPDIQIANRLGHKDTTITRKVYTHIFKQLEDENNNIGAELEKDIIG